MHDFFYSHSMFGQPQSEPCGLKIMQVFDVFSGKNFQVEMRVWKKILTHASSLFNQFFSQVEGELNHYLCFDNNILSDILKGDEEYRIVRRIAVGFFCNYVNSLSNVDVKIVLTPSLLNEYFSKTIPTKKCQFDQLLGEFLNALAILNIEILTLGFDGYSSYKKLANDIAFDEKQIVKFLNMVKSTNFGIPLVDGMFEWFPFEISNNYLKKIRLKYFSLPYFQYIISQKIGKRIVLETCDKRAAKKWKGWEPHIGRLLKSDKGNRVNGLADLELLSLCDVRSRFYNNIDKFVIIGLTFDSDLQNAIFQHSNRIVYSRYTKEGCLNGQNELNDKFALEQLEKMKRQDKIKLDCRRQWFSFVNDFINRNE